MNKTAICLIAFIFMLPYVSKRRHAGPKDVNREAELEPPSRVACSDLLGSIVITCFFHS